MFADVAYAMGAPSGGGAMGSLTSFLPLVLMFVVFYFLLIWPQQKKAKAHRQVLANLQKGDNVVTSSGIYGQITGITDTTVTLEIAEKVRIKVSRNAVAGVVKNPTT
jgi:preprotein translocase subunit YajC